MKRQVIMAIKFQTSVSNPQDISTVFDPKSSPASKAAEGSKSTAPQVSSEEARDFSKKFAAKGFKSSGLFRPAKADAVKGEATAHELANDPMQVMTALMDAFMGAQKTPTSEAQGVAPVSSEAVASEQGFENMMSLVFDTLSRGGKPS
jgi:hypothetical protein